MHALAESGLFGILIYSVLAGFGGYLFALLIGRFVLGPIYFAASRRNGAPFKVGETVRILTGRHRGKTVQVYSLWQHESVRVDLGASASEKYEDIFWPHELLGGARGALTFVVYYAE